MNGVNGDTQLFLQHWLENTISLHQTTLRLTPRRHCEDDPADSNEHPSNEKPRSGGEANENLKKDDNTYVVDIIV